MAQNSDFTKFLTSIQTPGDHRVVLASGLHKSIIETCFAKVNENMWIHVTHLPFTNPEKDKINFSKMMDHYRLFANELFHTVNLISNEFSDNGDKVVVDDVYLEQSKKLFVALIERLMLGDPKYLPYLNAEPPENNHLGCKFVIVKVAPVLHRPETKGSYNMFVGLAIHAFKTNNDGSVTFVKELYDNMKGIE